MRSLVAFLKGEEAATAIEYGLLAALISIAAISSMSLVGDGLIAAFEEAADKMKGPA